MASIRQNFIYSIILTGANYLFPLLVFPYVSRVLGVTNIGTCNFVNSLVQFFTLFSMMGIGTVGIREIARNRNDKLKLSNTFSSLILLNGITTAISVFVFIVIIFLVPRFADIKVLMLIGTFQLIFNFLAIDWFYKGLEEFKYVTIRTIIVRGLYVASVFIFVKSPSDYIIYYFLTTLSIVINACINCIYSRHFVRFSFRSVSFATIIGPFFILGIYAILTSMYTTFNVTFLGFNANDTEVGYYSTASNIFTLVLAVFTALTGVLLPRLSMLVAQNKLVEFKELLSKTTNLLLEVSIPIILFIEFFSPQVIQLLVGSGYEGAITPMRIIAPLIFVIGYEQILVTQTLLPLQKDKAVLINSVIGAVVGVVFNILLVPLYKSIGSSIVWFFSEVFVLISAQAFVFRYINISFPWRELFRSAFFCLPLVFVYILISKYIFNNWLQITSGALVLMIYIFTYTVYIRRDVVVIDFLYSLITRIRHR